MKKPIILKIILISLAIAIDLITKELLFNVDKTLIPGFISSRDVGGALNTGGAWGILGDSTIFLIIITVIFIGIFMNGRPVVQVLFLDRHPKHQKNTMLTI